MTSSRHYDEAIKTVSEFRAFAPEEPRLSAIIDAAYKYHFDRGRAAVADQKWGEAVDEYQRASDVKPSSESAAALKQAQSEFQSSTNQAAANAASQQSAAFQQAKQNIEAYEVLANLPDAQRALVKDQM